MFIKKLQAIKDRSGMNIKSGRVMMEVKDRDWLFAMIENLTEKVIQLEKDVISVNTPSEQEFYKTLTDLFDKNFPKWREQ